jgi:hypothetical protein
VQSEAWDSSARCRSGYPNNDNLGLMQ